MIVIKDIDIINLKPDKTETLSKQIDEEEWADKQVSSFLYIVPTIYT